MDTSIITKNYRKLVLSIGLKGMSWCCIDTLNWEIANNGDVMFSGYAPVEEQLWRVFVDNPALTRPYDEVVVLHNNGFNTFVPDALFDEQYLGSYLQFNTKVFETDVFAHDTVSNYEMNNIYVPLMNVNNFLIDQFGSFEYRHTASILVARLLEASRNIEEKQVFVHLQDDHFEIIAVQNQKLLLYNWFEYSEPQDFLYYLLFSMEQLFLNPETAKVRLLGAIDEGHACYALAYSYIRHIALYNPETLEQKYNVDTAAALRNFIIYNA